MVEEKLEIVKTDFSFLAKKVLGIVVFGSTAEGREWEKSDVDICIIAPGKDPKDIISEVFRKVDVVGKKYDVYVFEELPLYMKAEVMDKYIVIYGDPPEIEEYFRIYRKIWSDQKRRQELSKDELGKILSVGGPRDRGS